MRTLDAYEPLSPESTTLRETLASLSPLEMWRAWQEAADQVCVMDAVPLRRRGNRSSN
jgi:hypothetical protein